VAHNDLGRDEYNVYVERGIRPSMPATFYLQGRGHESLDINLGSFEQIPDDPMRITKYRFEMMFKKEFEDNGYEWKYQNIRDVPAKVNTTYTVSNLKPDTTYLMRVASLNVAGLSEWTEIKEFSTLSYEPAKESNNSKMLGVSLFILILTNFVCNLLNIH
jgi:hypothetical protein